LGPWKKVEKKTLALPFLQAGGEDRRFVLPGSEGPRFVFDSERPVPAF
jgi:hypothetical protein